MRVFVILFASIGIITISTIPSIYAESDDFRFIQLNDAYDLGDEVLVKFEKTTQQPCPSYEISMMKKGIPESKITYGVEPLCTIPAPVEPYLFNAEFEKSEFFDSVGAYIIQVTLDGETIQKEIIITDNRNSEHKFSDSFSIIEKQVRYVVPYQITSGTIDELLNLYVDADFYCHPVAHHVGEFLYGYLNRDLDVASTFVDFRCASGILHGLVENTIAIENLLHGTPTDQVDYVTPCMDIGRQLGPHAQSQCIHGMGHSIIKVHDYDTVEAVKECNGYQDESDMFMCREDCSCKT